METKNCPKCGFPSVPEDEKIKTSVNLMDPNEFIYSETTEIMKEKGWCFICACWQHRLEVLKDEKNWLIINGESRVAKSFIPNPTHGQRAFMGSGGTTQYFRKFDGTLIKSNNVWYQGNVPQAFRNEIPDNAEIITEAQYNELEKLQ